MAEVYRSGHGGKSEGDAVSEQKGFVCADCGNVFLQPPKCTTCGAQKLYDATVVSLQQSVSRYESGRVVLTGMVDELKESLVKARASFTASSTDEENNLRLKLHQITLERDAMLERIAETQLKEGHLTIKNCTFEPPGAECGHGQLARQCPLCEKDARIAELEQQLAMANDAAAKGDLARANAGGMEMRIHRLESICHAAYQLAGVVGAPVRFLDALALHEDVNVDELLPVTIEECEEFKEVRGLIGRG